MAENDNPIVALTLTFQDGSQRKHQFGTPVPQKIAMRRLSREVHLLGDEPEWDPPTGLDLIAQLAPKLDKYLVWWRLEQESCNIQGLPAAPLFRFLANDGTEIWMIEDEELLLCISKTLERMEDYEEAPHDE
jgi:hypothetical protein